MMRTCLAFVTLIAIVTCLNAQQQQPKDDPAANPSGMYTFLREGEFVQLTVEDGVVSGYVSRFGEGPSDKDQFIDQFFDKASLKGDHLSFNTKPVHGVWYEFSGDVARTAGKQSGQEGYRVIKGTLVQHTTDADKKDSARQRLVELKSFPQDLSK